MALNITDPQESQISKKRLYKKLTLSNAFRLQALADVLVAKGIVTLEEIQQRSDELRSEAETEATAGIRI